jgi:hypothetical protein
MGRRVGRIGGNRGNRGRGKGEIPSGINKLVFLATLTTAFSLKFMVKSLRKYSAQNTISIVHKKNNLIILQFIFDIISISTDHEGLTRRECGIHKVR